MLRQQLFALAQAEPQRRQFADVRTRHLRKRHVGDLAVAAVYGQDQFKLHAQSPSINWDGIIQHHSKPPLLRPVRATPPNRTLSASSLTTTTLLFECRSIPLNLFTPASCASSRCP